MDRESQIESNRADIGATPVYPTEEDGITYLQWLAGLAMQGLLTREPVADWNQLALNAFKAADAVIHVNAIRRIHGRPD